MDKIFLHGMQVKTLIGAYDWERHHQQVVVFDLDIGVAMPEKLHDDLNETVHYGLVCDTIRADLAKQSFLLLETLVEHVACLLFEKFYSIQFIRIKVVKSGILANVREVGVEIERHRVK